MNTTVTVETVHGLKDTFVVGTSGVVAVVDSARTPVVVPTSNAATTPEARSGESPNPPSAK